MANNLSIYKITEEAKRIESLLYKDEITEDDADCLKDELIECLETNGDSVLSVINQIDDNLTVITERARQLAELKKYYTSKKERLKEAIIEAMEGLDVKKISTPAGIISTRKTPGKLVIVDATKVPTKYTKIEYAVDNAKLKADVKNGLVGDNIAKIVSGKSLTIK